MPKAKKNFEKVEGPKIRIKAEILEGIERGDFPSLKSHLSKMLGLQMHTVRTNLHTINGQLCTIPAFEVIKEYMDSKNKVINITKEIEFYDIYERV